MAIIINGSSGISGLDGTSTAPPYQGTDSDTGVFFPAAGAIGITTNGVERLRAESNGNIGFGVTSPQATASIKAGTASTAPINIAAGVVLTTASSGTLEFGSPSANPIFMGTPLGQQRGVIPTAQYYALNAVRTGPTLAGTAGATTNTFSLLGVGCNLTGGIRYAYEIYFSTAKTSANAASILYAVAVTSGTLTSHVYTVISDTAAAAVTPAAANQMSNSITTGFANLVIVSAASAAAASSHNVLIKGVIDVATDVVGLNPQFGYNAAPTTSTIIDKSYMLIYPISVTGANTNVGTWA
jgi:hypothetical protein